MMGWLTWLAFHIHKRIFSQNRSLKKREEALLMAASFLNEGKATGVDIWSTSDQSGNAREVTL
jgi:hypothetical protein